MNTDQILLFALFTVILGMLLWGRYRHDLVAAGGLLCGVLLGLVPEEEAFSGFANHAVVVVALVLVASRALENSGALGLLLRVTANEKRSAPVHIALLGGIGAALSALINNVAALAMLIPLDVQAARRAKRPPGSTLMPLSFATILGGMVTLIGTPSNIVASAVRSEQLGSRYGMFDFTPVGGTVAICGLLFVALVGWRLVPARKDEPSEIDASAFMAELLVPEDSKYAGRVGAEMDEEAEKADVIVTGVIRDNRRLRGPVRTRIIEADDLLVVEGSTDAIAAFMGAAGLKQPTQKDEEDAASPGQEPEEENGKSRGPDIIEAVVGADSPVVGRTASGLNMRGRFDITLLGIARAGRISRTQISDRPLKAGDELLITGRGAVSSATLDQLGLIGVNRVRVPVFRLQETVLALGVFAAAIVAATAGYLSFTIAIAIAVAIYGAVGLVPARDFYSNIEWPVVVMLACLIPLGSAFENVGGTALIARGIADLTQGHSPILALVAIMVVTMTLSDLLNNVATMVIIGPVAIDLARRVQANPDTFLMGVAVAAACAFLTPIGHKNNTLIMGPGGYRFADYWRMGLPLELVVLAVAVPMLLLVWPI